jgi:hypothetical protein
VPAPLSLQTILLAFVQHFKPLNIPYIDEDFAFVFPAYYLWERLGYCGA